MSSPLPMRMEKPWGYEFLWVLTERYARNSYTPKQGYRLSRQFHRHKDAWQFVLARSVMLELGDGALMELVPREPDEGRHIPRGTVHRLVAVTEADVLEASTPELDDVVRLEDSYGRASPNGTASTDGWQATTRTGHWPPARRTHRPVDDAPGGWRDSITWHTPPPPIRPLVNCVPAANSGNQVAQV